MPRFEATAEVCGTIHDNWTLVRYECRAETISQAKLMAKDHFNRHAAIRNLAVRQIYGSRR